MTEIDLFSGLEDRFLGTPVEPDPVKWAKDTLGVHLWSKQREIMRLLEHTDRVAVPATHGIGKCQPETSLISLADGRVVTAGSLLNQSFDIITWDEEGKQIPGPAWATDNGVRPIYRVRTTTGREIERTGNHPLYAATRTGGGCGKRCTVHPKGWTQIDNLSVGDLVLVPERIEVEGIHPRPENEVKLAGYLLGDGGVTTSVTFTQLEGPAKDEFRCIADQFGCFIREVDHKTVSVVGSRGTGRTGGNAVLNMVRTWGMFGKKATQKTFPDWVWTLPNNQLALFLNRLFACDGWASVSSAGSSRIQCQIGICLANEKLIRQIELAMLRLGIVGRVDTRSMAYDQSGKRFPAWTWTINRLADMKRFQEIVGIYGKEEAVEQAVAAKSGMDRGGRESKWMRTKAPIGYRWEKVTAIEYVGDEPTVCISVPEKHAYVTTFVEHNSFVAAVTTARFLTKYPPGTARVITTAPTADQVKAVLWNEIGQLHSRSEGKLPGRVTQNTWWVGNYLAAMGRKPSEYAPGTFQGIHARHILVILDEADAIPKELWDGVEKLVTNAGKILAIGNPYDPQSEFARVLDGAQKPGEDGKFNKWHVVHIPATVTPNLTGEPVPEFVAKSLIQREFVEDRRREWGEDSALWKGGILAVHPDESEMTVVRIADVLAARRGFDSDEKPSDRKLRFENVQLGVDIAASEKGDETVVFERRDNKICRRWAVRSGEPEEVADLIVLAARQSGASLIHMDISGVGWALPTELKRRLPGVAIRGFMAQAAAEDPKQFVNRRSEGYWYLREALRNKAIDLSEMENADSTTTQATAARYSLYKGKIRVELKDDIKKRIGRSPDDSDALILAILPPDGATMPAPATARAFTKERATEESLRAQGADAPQVNSTPRAVLPREVPPSKYGVRSKRRSFSLRAR